MGCDVLWGSASRHECLGLQHASRMRTAPKEQACPMLDSRHMTDLLFAKAQVSFACCVFVNMAARTHKESC